MSKVFVVIEDWRIDSGESGIESSVFSTFEKALEYYNKLKERYKNDYGTQERLEDDETEFDEEVDDKSQYASIEVSFEDYDYYKIVVESKIIDSEELEEVI